MIFDFLNNDEYNKIVSHFDEEQQKEALGKNNAKWDFKTIDHQKIQISSRAMRLLIYFSIQWQLEQQVNVCSLETTLTRIRLKVIKSVTWLEKIEPIVCFTTKMRK